MSGDNDDNRVQYVFFAHRRLLDIWRDNGGVLVMDVTCKTNLYSLPLLAIVGITRTGLTIPLAHVLMTGEKADNFAWALTTLRQTMTEQSLPERTVIELLSTP